MKNIFIALAIVFALCLQGAAAQTATPQPDKDKLKAELARISKELQLTADQNAQIKTILTEEMEKLEPLQKEYDAKTQSIRAESRAKMLAVLTPEQQKHWDIMKQTKSNTERKLQPVKEPPK